MILPNLSHFYNVKKMVQGVWNIFCLVQAVMEGPKWPIFWDPAPFFLPYQNGSNLVESLLSTISSFAEIPGIFDFWKDQLLATTFASTFNIRLESWTVPIFCYDTKAAILPLRPILLHTHNILRAVLLSGKVCSERGYLSCDRHCAKFPSSSPYPLFLLAASSSSSDFHSWCVPEILEQILFLIG